MLWAEKRGLVPPAPPNPAMARGTALEPVARAAYEREVGGLMFPCQMVHPEHPWMRANLDGLSPDATTLLEVKCPGQADHALALKGEVPLHYMPQLQHYFAVTQATLGHYWSFDGRAGVLVVVRPDKPYIARLIQAEREFWALVQTNTPPEMTDRDVISRTDAAFLSLAETFLAAEAAKVEATARWEGAREALIAAAGSLARVRGGGVLVTRFLVKGNVDYKKIPELKGVDLEKYRGPSREQWRVAPEKIQGVE